MREERRLVRGLAGPVQAEFGFQDRRHAIVAVGKRRKAGAFSIARAGHCPARCIDYAEDVLKRIAPSMNLAQGRRVAIGAFFALALVLAAGCGANRLVATTNIPAPLVVKVPVTVALHVPKEFTEYVHTEKRWSTDWSVELGKAQSEALVRLITAMFERVVLVDSISNGVPAGQDIRAILEPSVEEYAFVTIPRHLPV